MPYGYMTGYAECVPVSSLISFTYNPDNPMPPRKSRPEILMVGSCRASIFRNTIRLKDGKEVEIPKVVLEVRYKNKHGRWCGTPAISLRELPKAILALQKAFDYLTADAK